MPNAVIVGAGMTGLSAAQVLTTAGWEVLILDKGQTPGGRFASRWYGERERRIDVGAQFLSVRDPDFRQAVLAWEERGLVRQWCTGIPVLDAGALSDGSDGFPRWLGIGGLHGLGRALARSFVVEQPATVTALRQQAGRWNLAVVAGDAVRGTAHGPATELTADVVILTQPAPQIGHLLTASALPPPTELATVRYDPCVAVVIDVPAPNAALLPHPGAARIEDPASPLSWVASAQGRGEAMRGDLLLLHARGDWSAARLELSLDQLASALLADATPTLRRLGITRELTHCNREARLWRYSRCVATCSPPWLSVAEAPTLLLAGDGFGDCPRVEGAWLSGRAAALEAVRLRPG